MNQEQSRWLKVAEAGILLRLSPKQVMRLMLKGELAYITVKSGDYRIQHPGDKFVEHTRRMQDRDWDRLDYVPLLNSSEVGALLGIDGITVRRHQMDGKLKGMMVGQRRLYCVEEIRRFLFIREKPLRKGKEYYSERLLRWAKERLYPSDPDLGALVDEVLRLQEPERSFRLEELIAAAQRLEPLTAIARAPRLAAAGVVTPVLRSEDELREVEKGQ